MGMTLRNRIDRLASAAPADVAVVVPDGLRIPAAGLEPGGPAVERHSDGTAYLRVPDRATNLDYARHLTGDQRRVLDRARQVWVMCYTSPATAHLEANDVAEAALDDPERLAALGPVVHLPIRRDPERDRP